MQVPLWVLKSSFQAYGSKMPPRPPDTPRFAPFHYGPSATSRFDEAVCPVCLQSIKGTDWVYRQAQHIHKICEKAFEAGVRGVRPLPPSSLETNRRARRRAGFHKTVGTTVPDGNLGDSEYRFWVGVKEDCSMFAMCRACRMSVYGEKERENHKKDEKLHVAGMACTQQLIEVYKRLLTDGRCVVCNGYTKGKKWGVPLCGEKCEEIWKFSQTYNVNMQVTLKKVREVAVQRAAEWAETQKNGGLKTSESGLTLPAD